MLTVELKYNGRLIGGAIVKNTSEFDPLSDYEIEAVETASPETGHTQDFRSKFTIRGHKRKQSVWALVAAVAVEAFNRRASGQFDRDPVRRDQA